ncbi:MAG TPA: serine/threonine-protein kinase, partial [Desulfosarcina sp.]|nr:serine/threonine-protein kinase [Desulfosarcina sp.]
MAKFTWIGKKLSGRYEIEELLGQGGMSAVYKATDPNLRRVVAVKLIHAHLSGDPDFVKRFEEEAAAVAQLRHPGIIQVFDFNHDDDSYYMVLEFVPGETFQDHLKRLNAAGRKISVANAVQYIADVCDAVDYAHQRGMIHRDIKPANLMLNVMGQAILMDFGIAKIVGGQRHTATGAVVGTAMYMAPEQIKGESPDRRADIYSLGVTLFEMLSGKPPFEADSAMTLMMMHVNDPIPDVRALNPEVPDDLVAVLDKALAKNPADRYQTAAQLASALRNVLGRLKTGVSTEAPAAPDATTIEKPEVPVAGPGATVVEPVETAPPSDATSVEEPAMPVGGTYVEPVSTPAERTDQTQAEPDLPVGTAAGAAGIASATEGQAVPPKVVADSPAAPRSRKIFGLSLPLLAGGIIGFICLLGVGAYGVSRIFAGGPGAAQETEEPVALVLSTETST